MNEHQITLGDLYGFIVKNLPDSWKFTLSMIRDEVSVTMTDPDGESVEVCRDDLDTGEMIQAYVNHARKIEGLPPAHLSGLET